MKHFEWFEWRGIFRFWKIMMCVVYERGLNINWLAVLPNQKTNKLHAHQYKYTSPRIRFVSFGRSRCCLTQAILYYFIYTLHIFVDSGLCIVRNTLIHAHNSLRSGPVLNKSSLFSFRWHDTYVFMNVAR